MTTRLMRSRSEKIPASWPSWRTGTAPMLCCTIRRATSSTVCWTWADTVTWFLSRSEINICTSRGLTPESNVSDRHSADVVLHHQAGNFEHSLLDLGGHGDLVLEQIRDQHLHLPSRHPGIET